MYINTITLLSNSLKWLKFIVALIFDISDILKYLQLIQKLITE